MEKTVKIGEKKIKLKTSGALPRIYRLWFNRDIFRDINLLATIEDPDELEAESMAVFENVAYAMAKHADPNGIPDDIIEWLGSFEDPNTIYNMVDDVIELWNAEKKETAKPKKESEK